MCLSANTGKIVSNKIETVNAVIVEKFDFNNILKTGIDLLEFGKYAQPLTNDWIKK